MLFPQLNRLKVKYHSVLMALSIESDLGGQVYGRKYYLVTYEDDSELIFLTTNEPDSEFIEHYLDDEFYVVTSFQKMLDDFEKSELVGLVIHSGFKSPPKYVYYDIITIDNSLKPIILEHLKQNISGYTDKDFTKKEQQQLRIWFDYLNE